MKILGVDPGSLQCGWAVVQNQDLLEFGVIKQRPKTPLSERLLSIYENLNKIISDHRPEVLVLEKAFVSRNVLSALVLGQVRGVCLLAGAKQSIQIQECTPTGAKKSLTGYGQASKTQIMNMVEHIYARRLPSDAADAVALALSYRSFVEYPVQIL